MPPKAAARTPARKRACGRKRCLLFSGLRWARGWAGSGRDAGGDLIITGNQTGIKCGFAPCGFVLPARGNADPPKTPAEPWCSTPARFAGTTYVSGSPRQEQMVLSRLRVRIALRRMFASLPPSSHWPSSFGNSARMAMSPLRYSLRPLASKQGSFR